MSRMAVVFVSALLLVGCAHVHPVDPAGATELEALNSTLAGRLVTVKLADGTEMLAHDVAVSRETVSLRRERFPGAVTAWPERNRSEIPLAEVVSVEVKCRGRGALDGALIGILGGVVGGAVVGAASFDEPDVLIGSRTDAALLGSVIFGVLGTGVGTLSGVGIGSTDVYEFCGTGTDTAVGRIWR